MWYYPNLEDKLKPAGIKVLRLDLYKPYSFAQDIDTLGRILGKEERAKEYLDFAQSCVNKIEQQVKDLTPEEKVGVYSEFFMPYVAYSKGSGPDQLIGIAGGVNIFAEEAGPLLKMPGYIPEKSGVYCLMSPEAIAEKNPGVVIKDYMNMTDYMKMGRSPKTIGYTSKPDAGMMETARDDIMNRPGWKGIDAVKEGRVYIFAFPELASSPRWPVALGYIAKWCYPDLFPDLDPQSFHAEWLKKWHGLEYKGIYVYPEE
jgi:iron complex transport system substrate-binding protein